MLWDNVHCKSECYGWCNEAPRVKKPLILKDQN